jgi:hypothetical protein
MAIGALLTWDDPAVEGWMITGGRTPIGWACDTRSRVVSGLPFGEGVGGGADDRVVPGPCPMTRLHLDVRRW